jgi:hypothetical protein
VEGVAVPGDRSDEPRPARRVAERGADLRHQVVEARIGDERSRPQALEQLCLRNRLRAPIEKELEKLEGLGGQRLGASVAEEKTPTRVELGLSEKDAHRGPEGIRLP